MLYLSVLSHYSSLLHYIILFVETSTNNSRGWEDIFTSQVSIDKSFIWGLVYTSADIYIYTPGQKNSPPPHKSYFAVATVNFKAMIDNIVANRSSFYWPKLFRHSDSLVSTSKSKFRNDILSQNGAQTLPNFLKIEQFLAPFLNIFLWWFFLLSAWLITAMERLKCTYSSFWNTLHDWKWSGCNFKVKMWDFCRGDFFDQEFIINTISYQKIIFKYFAIIMHQSVIRISHLNQFNWTVGFDLSPERLRGWSFGTLASKGPLSILFAIEVVT